MSTQTSELVDANLGDTLIDEQGNDFIPRDTVIVVQVQTFPLWITIIIFVIAGVFFVACCACIIRWIFCVQLTGRGKRGLQRGRAASVNVKYEPMPELLTGDITPLTVQPNAEAAVSPSSPPPKYEPQRNGRIKYSIDYNYNTEMLNVEILECVELPKGDRYIFGIKLQPDSYVKLYLSPDMDPVFQTSVRFKTACPKYSETFTFPVDWRQLPQKAMEFEVYDFNRTTRHVLIGRARMPFEGVNIQNPFERWSDLESTSVRKSLIRGSLCLSVRYLRKAHSSVSKMTIIVMEAKDLGKTKESSDVFVKLSMLINSRPITKKKTSRKRDTVNPYFDESFTFDVGADQLKLLELLITVYETVSLQWGSMAIGQVIMGDPNKMTQGENEHWNDILANEGHFVARWHPLCVVE